MRHVIITTFFLLLPSFLFSMEELVFVLSQIEQFQRMIQADQIIKNKEIRYYFDETLPKVTLSTLKDKYCDLSEKSQRKLVRCMSPKLLLLNSIALWLPEETQKNIYGKLLKGNHEERGVDIFYSKRPMLESIELYQQITKKIGFDKPIAPLYTLKSEELVEVLEKINLLDNNYFGVVMSSEEHQKIQSIAMNKEIQQYFIEYDAYVLSKHHMKEYKSAVGLGVTGFVVAVPLSGALFFTEILGCLSFSVSGIICLTGLWCAHDLREANRRKIIEIIQY